MSGTMVPAPLESTRRLGSEGRCAWGAVGCRGAAWRGATCVKHRRSKGESRTAEMSGRRSDCAMGCGAVEVLVVVCLGPGLPVRTFFWMLGCDNGMTPPPP